MYAIKNAAAPKYITVFSVKGVANNFCNYIQGWNLIIKVSLIYFFNSILSETITPKTRQSFQVNNLYFLVLGHRLKRNF